MLFVSFQFNKPPIIFNAATTNIELAENDKLNAISDSYNTTFEEKNEALLNWSGEKDYSFEKMSELQVKQDSLRKVYKS